MRLVQVTSLISVLFAICATPIFAADDAVQSLGDADKGRRIFVRCQTCHNLTADARPKLGPNLDNIFGRTAGTSDTYLRYSEALKNSGIIWNDETLDAWLANPPAMLPGNKMVFPGLRSEKDRRDVLAYLRDATIEQ